jgi:hypothetical protein
VIAAAPWYAYWYAENIVKGQFPEGEKAIARNPTYSYWYATVILKRRFLAGEEIIAAPPYTHKDEYEKKFNVKL